MNDKTNHDIEVLKEIHKNAGMSVDALSFLEKEVSQDVLKNDIKMQITSLSEIERKARQELEAKGKVPWHNGTKLGLWMSTRLHALNDNPGSHMARMLIEGSNTGINDLTRALNDNPLADDRLKDTAQRLLNAEQQPIETMKQCL